MKRFLLALLALTWFASAVPVPAAESGPGLVTTETVDRGNFHPAPLTDIESAQASFKLASITLTGAGKPPSAAAVAFVPNAVLYTQEYTTKWAAGIMAASPNGLAHFWACGNLGSSTNPTPTGDQSFSSQIVWGNVSNVPATAEDINGANWTHDNSSLNNNIRANLNNAVGAEAHNSALGNVTLHDQDGTDCHSYEWAWAVDQTISANVRRVTVWKDGAQIVNGVGDTSGTWTGPQTVDLATYPFFINGGGATFTGYTSGTFIMSQFYFKDMGATSPLDASGNPSGWSDLSFYNAGPVDLGALCNGPGLGQPDICLDGPAASWTTNKGTVVTAATANGIGANPLMNQPWPAPYAPGEVPDRPFRRWATSTTFNGSCTEQSQTCSIGPNLGNKVYAGDLICKIIIGSLSGSNGTHNENFLMSGYTNPFGASIQGSGSNAQFVTQTWLCKTAPSNIAAGTEWTPDTFTWTKNTTLDTWAGASITIIDFGKYGAGGTTPTIAVTGSTAGAANGSLPCPTVTAPAGNSLIVCTHAPYAWDFSTTTNFAPPATATPIYKLKTGGVGNRPLVYSQKVSSAGAVSLTAQESAALGGTTLATAVILN